MYVRSVSTAVARHAFLGRELGTAKQELDGPPVPGSLVDQRRLGPSHAMRAMARHIESDGGDPLMHTIRVYCRADTCGDVAGRLGNRQCSAFRFAFSIRAATAALVGSVNSNCTGRRVFRCTTIPRGNI